MLQGKYNQLSFNEREDIRYYYVKNGYSIRKTARLIGRDPSTVSREIRRNQNDKGQYGALSAHRMARARQYNKKTGIALKSAQIRLYVIMRLIIGWSPEQISGRLPLDHAGWSISHETIYLYVYQEARWGSAILYRLLPRKRKKRKQRYRAKSRRNAGNQAQIPAKTPISARPQAVNERKRPGDWEGDMVNGPGNRSGIAVLIERFSRYVCIAPLLDRSAKSMLHAVISALGAIPAHLRQSITVDNGSENALHRSWSRMLGNIPVYFCEPYKSWQKGSVEHMNGLIRRVFPKGTNFASLDPHELIELQQCLNNRPRKCLGFRTSHEVFSELCRNKL